MAAKLIRFDWAIKKLLRNKANFTILEGFLTELLKFDIKIESILESEGNKSAFDDKYNRVDILVRASDGELMLVEVQNESQIDYFQRMLYGASKLITEYIKEGDPYSEIKKVFSINIVYFGLGQGEDYVYEYKGHFEGLHKNDRLKPTGIQQRDFDIIKIADIFPKYYLLKVNNFDDVAKSTLDEWIYFLKNSEVKDGFKAKGLEAVREKLKEESLSAEEKVAYEKFKKSKKIERSELETARKEGMEKGMEKGSFEKEKNIILSMNEKGLSVEQIADFTQVSMEKVRSIIKEFG